MSQILPRSELTREPSRLAQFARITLKDGSKLGFTNFWRDLVDPEDGLIYKAGPGFGPSAVQGNRKASESDNGSGTMFFDDENLTPERLESGLLDGASFVHFVSCYEDLSAGRLVKNKGFLSGIEAGENAFSATFSGMEGVLGQSPLDTTGALCRYELGDEDCKVNLNGVFGGKAARFSGAVTGLGSNSSHATDPRRNFGSSGMNSFPAEWFADGRVKFSSGPNSKFGWFPVAHSGSGFLTLALLLPFPPGVGDSFECVAGCNKVLKGDCKNKWNNVVNFGGEPNIPGEKLYDKDDKETFI